MMMKRVLILTTGAQFSRPEQCGDIVPGLQEIGKACPSIFAKPSVLKLLVDVLKWSGGPAPREGHWQHNLAVSLLMTAFSDADLWPVSLVSAFLTDSLDKRSWVEVASNAPFVGNIVTAFPCSSSLPSPLVASKQLIKLGGAADGPDAKRRKLESQSPTLRPNTPAAAAMAAVEGEEEIVLGGGGGKTEDTSEVRPRYRSEGLQREVHKQVLELVRAQMDTKEDMAERRAKSLLKTLPLLMGYDIVRHLVAFKIESWINNTNTVRFTRELMSRLANECTMETEHETMALMLKMRPKVHATKEHLETIAMLARTNVHLCQIALDLLMREETSNFDFLTTNKTLRHKQQFEVLLRASGTAHLYVDRPLAHGGGRERLLVVDAGAGPMRFNVHGLLRMWTAGVRAGCVVVATEAQACGTQGLEGDKLAVAIAACSASLAVQGAAGLVVVMSSTSKAPQKVWPQQRVAMVPVVIAPLGEGTGGLLEAAAAGLMASLVRTPIEVEVAFQLKVLADRGEARKGLTALVRKLLKLGELEPVSLCAELMEPVSDMLHGDADKKKEWGTAILEMVCFVCIFQAWRAQEVAATSMQVERQANGEHRAAKAMSLMRTQIALIQEAALRWAYMELPRVIGAEGMADAVRPPFASMSARTPNAKAAWSKAWR